MKVVEYFVAPDREHWLQAIGTSDWTAGQYLHQLLQQNQFHACLGEKSRLLLLTEDDQLIAFCTYAQRDEIPDPSLTPWTGFVYTFPPYRGKRRMGKLLETVYRLAKSDGFPCVYISTDHVGLYEKYACRYWKEMRDIHGNNCHIYRMDIHSMNYSDVLGQQVSGTIDRPLGSCHPRHPEMLYPVNYGYVDGQMAGDGAEQDVYVMGCDQPLKTFTGTVIAVIHRLNDCEDKWIVSLDGKDYSDAVLQHAVSFQEQYFMGEWYR